LSGWREKMGGEKNHPLQKRGLSGQALFNMNMWFFMFFIIEKININNYSVKH